MHFSLLLRRARCGPARGRHDNRTTGPNAFRRTTHEGPSGPSRLPRRVHDEVDGAARVAAEPGRAGAPRRGSEVQRARVAHAAARGAQQRGDVAWRPELGRVVRAARQEAQRALRDSNGGGRGERRPVERREEHVAAGPREARARGDERAVVGDVLEHLERAHDVERRLRERPVREQRLGRARDHGEARPRRRARGGGGGGARARVEAHDVGARGRERAREEPAAAADVRHPLPAQAAGPRPHVVRARGVQRVQRAGAARAGRVGPDDGAELGHLRLADRRRAAQRQARRGPRCPRREACGPHL